MTHPNYVSDEERAEWEADRYTLNAEHAERERQRQIRERPQRIEELTERIEDLEARAFFAEQFLAAALHLLEEAREEITDLRESAQVGYWVTESLLKEIKRLEESEAMRHPNVIPMPSRRAA
jgi:hypothetical protein